MSFSNSFQYFILSGRWCESKEVSPVLQETFCLTALSSEETFTRNKFGLNQFGSIFMFSYSPQQNLYPSVTCFHKHPYEMQGKMRWLLSTGLENRRPSHTRQFLSKVQSVCESPAQRLHSPGISHPHIHQAGGYK